MPRPTSATTVQRPALKAMLMEYISKLGAFIGLQAMPTFDVPEKSADYPVLPLEALLNAPDTKRRPRGGYHRGDWEFEMDSYNCLENGHEEPVDEVEAKLYSRFFDAELVSAQIATEIVLRAQEKRIADMLFNDGNFSATSITHEWDDAANAVPITDCKTGIKAIHDATGLTPDTLIIAFSTYQSLGLNAQIIDRIKYDNGGIVLSGDLPLTALAKALGVQRVLVGGGRYNSAKKGQTASLADIWNSEYAMLCVTSSGASIKEPCVGRTFNWTADVPANYMVESYEEPQTRSTIIRVRQHTDEELIMTSAAYLMDNITT